MPVFDAYFILRDGSTDLDADELTPTGIRVGASPAEGMKVFIHCPQATGTDPTLDATLEQSANNTDWYDVVNATFTQITAAGYYEIQAQWTGPWIRLPLDTGGTTPNFGKVKAGVTPGVMTTS